MDQYEALQSRPWGLVYTSEKCVFLYLKKSQNPQNKILHTKLKQEESSPQPGTNHCLVITWQTAECITVWMREHFKSLCFIQKHSQHSLWIQMPGVSIITDHKTDHMGEACGGGSRQQQGWVELLGSRLFHWSETHNLLLLVKKW